MTNNNEYNGQDVTQIRTQLTGEAVKEFDALTEGEDDLAVALENYDGEHYEEITNAVRYQGQESSEGLTPRSHGASDYWDDLNAFKDAKEGLNAPDPREFIP